MVSTLFKEPCHEDAKTRKDVNENDWSNKGNALMIFPAYEFAVNLALNLLRVFT